MRPYEYRRASTQQPRVVAPLADYQGWARPGDPVEPHFQHQERPKPLMVIAASVLMLCQQVADKGFRYDAALQECGRGQAIPQQLA